MKESTIRSKIKKVFHYLQGRNRWRARFKHLFFSNGKRPCGARELSSYEVLLWAEKNIGNKNAKESFTKFFEINLNDTVFTDAELDYIVAYKWLIKYSPLNPEYKKYLNNTQKLKT